MPELPEVEAARRVLEPVMRGARFDTVLLRRANLRRPFPVDFAARLVGREALAVGRRAKYLVVPISSGETLVMHLGMSGDFQVARQDATLDDYASADAPRHEHVVFAMSSGWDVRFTDPRRFGVMDLLSASALAAHPVLSTLGPEPLADGFDGATLARACAGRTIALKVALLDQRVVAGVGNIYAAEALHAAALSPLRRASTIATPGGRKRPSADRLAEAVRAVLMKAVTVQTRGDHRGERFRVYDREGERCPRRGCGGTIRRFIQAGRSTFYCPRCQR